jgi:hypothetical protein
MAHLVQSAFGSSHAALDAAERADPRGHAIHLLLALLWAFLQSITNAGEGIAWGLLLGFCILRVPKIWRCWSVSMRDPLCWTMFVWFAWTSLTSAWGPDLGPATPSAIPDRWLLTPLMLWPVMGRPWLVLAAIAGGGVLHASSALVLSWRDGAWASYGEMRALSAQSMTHWQFVSAFVLCLAGARWMAPSGRVAAIAGVVPCAVAVWILAIRTVMAAAVIGFMAIFVRPMPRALGTRWALFGTSASLLLVGVFVVARSPAWARVQDGLRDAEHLRTQGRIVAAVSAASSTRLTLIRAAIDIGLEHPILGGGAGWFAARLPQWALVEIARKPEERAGLDSMLQGSLANAHSALLHAWVDGGLPSAVLLATLLFGLAWRLWKQSCTAPIAAVALALFSIVLVNVPFGIATTKAPGALIAICLAISWLGAGARARRIPQSGQSVRPPVRAVRRVAGQSSGAVASDAALR